MSETRATVQCQDTMVLHSGYKVGSRRERHLGTFASDAYKPHAKTPWTMGLARQAFVPSHYRRVAGAAKPKSCRIVRASGANSIIPLCPSSVSLGN
jgi:hypothetical protein